MKKIIALALALIMVLSMGVVALAYDCDYQPGEKYVIDDYSGLTAKAKANFKVSSDFTSSKVDGQVTDYKGAAMIESIAFEKNAEASKLAEEPIYDLVVTLKESLTGTSSKDINGVVKVYDKDAKTTDEVEFAGTVGNDVVYIAGEKKAANANDYTEDMLINTVLYAEDAAGYITFTDGFALTGLVKVAKDEKAQVYFTTIGEDDADAIEEYLGEDYDAIVEEYNFGGSGFEADVEFTYEAYSDDPHYFYAWDGEKFVDLEGKYNDDEEVDAYEFTAAAKGIIIVTDVEIAAAGADTKNPDTGANDVVGVAAALAVVSLVAAGAVSLKK